MATVLTRLRSELSEVISAVPDGVSKGADLHRALKIDRTLSWKVFKVASVADPVAAGPHVPSPANLNTFLKAAAKHGVPAELVESASRVANEFERMVSRHAGDRATFDSMVSALADSETLEQIDLVNRRLAFRGQRHIYGVQAKAQLKLAMVQPAKDPMTVDWARVEGLVGLRQLREGAPLLVSQAYPRNDDGSGMNLVRESLDPASGSQPISLLRDFCSEPLPEFRESEPQPGDMACELLSNGIGKLAAITCIEGHVVRSTFPRYRDKVNRFGANAARVRTPCEVLIIDLLIHEGTNVPVNLAPLNISNRLGDDSVGLDNLKPRDLLPVHDRVMYLGRGPSVLHTPDIPRHAEMGRYLFKQLGWDGDKFDVYRLRIEYPVMPSEVMISFELPEAPTE